jgi:hypothetical protein
MISCETFRYKEECNAVVHSGKLAGDVGPPKKDLMEEKVWIAKDWN